MSSFISLFSGAGIGDYAFSLEGFTLVSSVEIDKKRIAIQKLNHKKVFNDPFVCGDMNAAETVSRVLASAKSWKESTGKEIDVVVATPPCQGMSTANYKKKNETERNSLVVSSLDLISKVKPRYFILENVKSFLKTPCKRSEFSEAVSIESAIQTTLGHIYNIYFDVINFADYGVPSSRNRTIVIGTRKDLLDLSPLLVFPTRTTRLSLHDAIAGFPSLKKLGDFSKDNLFHFFRPYPAYMRDWIKGLPEGHSAFDKRWKNKPYKLTHGVKLALKSSHLGNKFARMIYSNPAPTIHTRSDQIASNRTIHPVDDRVLSIAELMKVMTIPESFRWFTPVGRNPTINEIKKNELTIRKCIGESVPTSIFSQIAHFINLVDSGWLNDLSSFSENPTKRLEGTFYTPQAVIYNIISSISKSGFKKKKISLLDPSCGRGNFIPQLAKYFQSFDNVKLICNDIDSESISLGRSFFEKFNLPPTVSLQWLQKDFLSENFPVLQVDAIFCNPPYVKKNKTNLYVSFFSKSLLLSKRFSFIVPKSFLNGDSDSALRQKVLETNNLTRIVEFPVNTFKDVYLETLIVSAEPTVSINVEVARYNEPRLLKKRSYIQVLGLLVPYRDSAFDLVYQGITPGVFNFFRDREIRRADLKEAGAYRVVKSKNLAKGKILDICGYDSYVDEPALFASGKHMNRKAIMVPNFTYNFRAAIFPKYTITNGSIALLWPKNSNLDLKSCVAFFNSEEFGHYYRVLQSHSKFTININKSIVNLLGSPS